LINSKTSTTTRQKDVFSDKFETSKKAKLNQRKAMIELKRRREMQTEKDEDG
jgi:hypothetical protein